jgi:hypothetical protein
VICWSIALALSYCPLHRYSTAHGFNSARKLDEDAVAGSFNYSALVLFDYRVDATASKLFETMQCPSFVLTDQSAVTDYVGCQNGRKAALHALEHRSPPSGLLAQLDYQYAQSQAPAFIKWAASHQSTTKLCIAFNYGSGRGYKS